MCNTPWRKTGPKTSTGKANSSKNSTKHGLCGNPSKLFPNETQEQYNAVRDRWFAEYDSDSPGTAMLVEQLINFDRQVRFSTNSVIETEIALYQAENAAERDEALLDSLHKDLKNKLRYQTQHERSFQRALRNIEQFGQRRVREELARRRLDVVQLSTVVWTAILSKKNGVDPEVVLKVCDYGQAKPESQAEPDEKTPPL